MDARDAVATARRPKAMHLDTNERKDHQLTWWERGEGAFAQCEALMPWDRAQRFGERRQWDRLGACVADRGRVLYSG